MNKKRIAVLIATFTVMISSFSAFAWYTAEDRVRNSFSTGTTDDPSNLLSGVKIDENFKPEEGKSIYPGVEVNKDVRAKNTASYNSFIRIKFDKNFTKATDGVNLKDLDSSKILLNLNSNNMTSLSELKEGKWVDGEDGYFYYLQSVEASGYTEYLLDSVTLDLECNKNYKYAEYKVTPVAESVQASNSAAKNVWKDANKAILDKLTSMEAK